MATTNPITGDSLISRGASKAYLDNYDLIFRRKGNPEKEEENGSTKRPNSERENKEADSSDPVA